MLRILSLAGGGLRGAFAVGFLAAIERQIDGPLSSYFDIIAGTSTGAITASSLSYGMRAADVQAFYEKHSRAIFYPRPPMIPRRAVQFIYPLVRKYVNWRLGENLDHFFRSRYCPEMLEKSMIDGFGSRRLSDVSKCRLIIPAVNLTDGVTCVFRTPHLPLQRPEYDWKISEIILAATAAPTYFPHMTMPDGKNYADGGLWAIDPGVVALSEAARILRCDDGRCDWEQNGTEFDADRVHMLSLGTGQADYSLSPPGAEAGMLFWSRHVAELMSVAQVQGTQLPLQIVLGERYQQFDFQLEDQSWTLDNVEMTERLFEIGAEDGLKAFDSLRDTFFSEQTSPYEPFNTSAIRQAVGL